MIVCCPSCRTRYRHEAEPGIETLQGQCSHCDEAFPLVGAKRAYVLVPAQREVLVPAGMDDPGLAARIGAAAGTPPQADPFETPFEPPAAGAFDRPLDGPTIAADERPPAAARDAAPSLDFGVPLDPPGVAEGEGLEATADVEPGADTEPIPATPPLTSAADAYDDDWLTDLLAAVLVSLCGAALAYPLAIRLAVDPLTWTAIGAGAGLLVGWISLRWIARGKD